MFHKDPYNFTDKTHSGRGIVAVILSTVCFVGAMVITILAVLSKGTLPSVFGLAGSYMLLIAIVAVIMALSSYQNDNTRMTFKYCGTVTSLLVFCLWLAIGFMGYL